MCDGENGGAESDVCRSLKPSASACGLERNTCAAGIGNDLAAPDTTSEHRWTCGSTVCSSPQPSSGACGTARNTCAAGRANPNAYNDTTSEYRWRCDGLNGGSGSGMCSSHRYSEPATSDPVAGVCGTSRYTCSAGRPNQNAYDDTASEHRWRCDGFNGGSGSGMCRSSRTADCGAVKNTCNNGATANDLAAPDTTTHYRWTCGAATCSLPMSSSGVCGTSRYACSAGRPNQNAYDDTTSEYRWRCDGLNGAPGSGMCTASRQPSDPGSPPREDGVCSTDEADQCNAGTFRTRADTDSHDRWYCDGRNGGPDGPLFQTQAYR